MAKYSVELRQTALDDAKGIKKYYRREIFDTIERLLPEQAKKESKSRIKKLRGFQTLYRLRVREYRVFYRAQGIEVVVLMTLSRRSESGYSMRKLVLMNTVPITEARKRLSECIEECKKAPVVIVRNGKREAILVPYDDDEYAALTLQYSTSYRKAIRKAEGDTTSYSLDEAKQLLGL